MLKISALRAYKAETHNLEVPGSSPGWSTNPRIKELEQSVSLFFVLIIGERELRIAPNLTFAIWKILPWECIFL
jgi:hypothetical protein